MFASPLFAPIAVAALAFAGAAPAQEETAEDKILRGVALYQQEKYEEAIKLYQEVLAQHPRQPMALAELAISLNAHGDYALCAATGEKALGTDTARRLELFTLTGICYRQAKQNEKAAQVFARGREEFPDDSQLAYNFAVTQLELKRLREARDLAKAVIARQPSHSASYLVLALAYDGEGYDIPSLLAALRFLSLAPRDPYAREMAQLAYSKLFAFVRHDPETNEFSVVVPPDAPTDEGDFEETATFLGQLAGAHLFLPDKPSKHAIDRAATVVKGLLEYLSEKPGPDDVDPIVQSRLIEPLATISKESSAWSFGYVVFLPLELEGVRDWLRHHKIERISILMYLDSKKRTAGE